MLSLLKGLSVLKTSSVSYSGSVQVRLRLVFDLNGYMVHRESFCPLSYVMTEDFLYHGNDLRIANSVFERNG